MSDTHNAAPADPNAGKPAAADPNAGTPPANAAAGTPPVDPNATPGTPPVDPNAGKPPAGNDQFWRDAIDPQYKPQAERFASLNDVFKSINDLRTDNSQRVKLPGENASDEDIAKFRKALGIPDKPDGYKIEAPEGIEMSEADKELAKLVMPMAHKHHVPEKAFNGFVQEFMSFSRELQNQAVENIKKFGQDSEAALKKEWGRDFDTNIALANRVAEVLGADFKKFLNETPLADSGMLGDHPIIVKVLATLGRRMDESEVQIGATPQEKQSIQSQIDELNKKVPVGSPGYTNPDHQRQLQTLFSQLHGGNPIVGASGRAA